MTISYCARIDYGASEMSVILDYLATNFTIFLTQQNTIVAVSPPPSPQTYQSLLNRLRNIEYTSVLNVS
jgi:hypothetical protein